MMFDLPDDETLYAALLGRDPAWDGRAWVGVSSTGVFCRLTCPARKPKRENCTFFDTMGGAIEAGYRACKRCHPMAPAAEGEPAVKALLAALEADPARRWAEGDVAAMGFELSTVRRAFKRHFGMTFLEMARLARLRAGGAELVGGASVIEAQMEAGYASGSAFRAAFAGWTGLAPGAFVKDAVLRADWIETPMGAMVAVASEGALHLLEFTERKALPAELAVLRRDAKGSLGFGRFGPTDRIEREISDFMSGVSAEFVTPLRPLGTPFSREVWRALRMIPAGETRSYGQLARDMGRVDATRAVARANGANPIAIVIPCHRVLGEDGSLTGYGGGLWRKQKLIELERGFAAQINEMGEK
ncbi:bifunctional transcriptional activator/DNA repair enzyme AdaA [uncultured Sulfitobacter sp.]|uniref:bifunctional transcriptional activator/DNA repair enzyme AdaA n=1 Tax=uncultured Sulfitobacter sp. TaxID=191468 RepID=UPI00260E38B4|nr:trifunctional transcriptional activator/DNA repair protein Ada/methylated-DNA--[protein]-cysteine S-methyltransferase [uncultured Sulfitobacter sp.]